ncbi:MAG TPA: beta-galactosidase, partial [Armatimonadota bacterium]|nr:beta-galactosidase [Armatimonadota bacterium]
MLHACPNNPVYREHCARITKRMAEEFGQNANIIGWQIDNEVFLHKNGCFCPSCREKFLHQLQARFGTIEALNAAWG